LENVFFNKESRNNSLSNQMAIVRNKLNLVEILAFKFKTIKLRENKLKSKK